MNIFIMQGFSCFPWFKIKKAPSPFLGVGAHGTLQHIIGPYKLEISLLCLYSPFYNACILLNKIPVYMPEVFDSHYSYIGLLQELHAFPFSHAIFQWQQAQLKGSLFFLGNKTSITPYDSGIIGSLYFVLFLFLSLFI